MTLRAPGRKGNGSSSSPGRSGIRTPGGPALVGMGSRLSGGTSLCALTEAGQAIEVATAIGAQPVLAGGHLTNGLVYEMTGRLSEARDELAQAITLSRRRRRRQ